MSANGTSGMGERESQVSHAVAKRGKGAAAAAVGGGGDDDAPRSMTRRRSKRACLRDALMTCVGAIAAITAQQVLVLLLSSTAVVPPGDDAWGKLSLAAPSRDPDAAGRPVADGADVVVPAAAAGDSGGTRPEPSEIGQAAGDGGGVGTAAGPEMARSRSLPVNFCKTSSTGWEVILESLLGNLFREDGLVPPGSVLDVGAQFGEQACHFATSSPDRTVQALDPSPNNVAKIRERFGELPNLRVRAAGVGAEAGRREAPDGSFQMGVGETFEVVTLDGLFHDRGERLGFAHIDVEGFELDVLRGGAKTLRSDLPLFTVELRVHGDPSYTRDLLGFMDELGYDAYVVDEVCGFPHMDYRNVLGVPRRRSADLVFSDAFNFALATEAIFRVDADTINSTVYPCCALGGECCPGGDAKAKDCCGEDVVRKWLEREGIRRPLAMRDWRSSKKETEKRWWRLRQRPKIK